MKRLVILISGRGSNMEAIVKACAAEGWPAEVAAVISNRPDAGGLQFAAAHGIATAVVDHKAYASREAFDAELFTLLAMCTPSSWLARMPSYKDQVAANPELATYGFLGYPLLQAADILLYKPAGVPVGEDQAAHVEVTREVARRFNRLYAEGAPVFAEPQALLTETARVPGLDGQKMSKSLDNAIAMRDEPEVTAAKIRTMPTDPQRVRRTDAGDPARCPVWPLHQIYTDDTTRAACEAGCRTATQGCLDCKQPLIEAIQREQAPWRERAAALDPQQVKWTLELGTERARAVARKTLREVRGVMGLVT